MKKRIGIIGLKGLPAIGGAAAVGENIIEQLKDKYEFTVYSVDSHTNNITGEYNGFMQIVFKSFFLKKINTLFYYLKSLFHVLFFSKYNLIHLHHSDAAFLIPLLKLKYPVVVTTHGSHNIGKISKWNSFHWYFKFQIRFLHYASVLTCVSKNEKKFFKKKYSLNFSYIPNGINLNKANDKFSNLIQENYIFFGAGRIIESKGCDILLKALINMNYQGLIVIAGSLVHSKVYTEELLHMAKKLNVKFVGLIKDKELLLEYVKNSLLFVYPSYLESMSMMLLEAASVKAKIICSDIVENKDIFNENEVTFFKSKSVDDLISKIYFALNNSELLDKKSFKAYEKLLKFYNWQIIAKKYDQIYQKLLYD